MRCKKLELNLLPLSLVAGSFAKWGVMTLTIVKWILPTFGLNLVAAVTYYGLAWILLISVIGM